MYQECPISLNPKHYNDMLNKDDHGAYVVQETWQTVKCTADTESTDCSALTDAWGQDFCCANVTAKNSTSLGPILDS